MTNVVKLPQLAWYEAKELKITLPDSWQVEVCNMAGYNRLAMNDNQIKASITNLIGTPPIRELAKGKNEVVIIFDDITRITKVARIVPYVLEELAEAGIPDSKVRFIAGIGTHGTMDRIGFAKKLGEETLARFPVYNHNPFDNCTYVGTTSYGTKVFINAEVMKCNFKITIGSIVPHIDTFFSGGGKLILPGVASVETIIANHSLPVINRNYEENPIRLNIEEAAKLVGVDVSIECLVNLWGDTSDIFAGAPKPAHAAGVQEAKAHYLTPKAEGKDIVIANTYAKASEFILGAFTAFPSITQKGGNVILICNAPEGHIIHYLNGTWGRTIGGKLRVQVAIPQHVRRLIVYSEYPEIASMGYFEESPKILLVKTWDNVLKSIENFPGKSAAVAVYPTSDISYFG